MATGSEPSTGGGLRSALGWLVFPVVPALIGSSYQRTLNLSFGPHGGPDPSEWTWGLWVVLLGPLIGYGFLAGSSIGLIPEPGPRGLRSWLSRPWFRVGVAPWIGFVLGAILYFGFAAGTWAVHAIHPPSREWRFTGLDGWNDDGFRWYVNRGLICGCLGIVSYGWLAFGLGVLKRARRQNRMGVAIFRGAIAAAAFVGSLFGGFWAITQFWRDHFFDKRLMPILLLTIGLAMLAGCASQLSYGEVRRRELFQAMLLAWLIGMAFLWRWLSRPRARPPS